jgi:signal transduction histidine kinase/ActR/RegA family two-component response regulator
MGEHYATSGIGIVAYTVFMVAGARRQTEGTEQLIRLQLDNAALATKVQLEKEVVERANRDLQLEIEQRERTETALRASKAEAEAANASKSQFLANMSHELRTPLNGILGTSELLMRSLPNMGQLVKHVKYAQTIRGAGERLLHLINDILDMARIEAGAMRLEAVNFEPRSIITEAVELMTAQCADKGLTLSVNVSPQVPTLLRGDHNRLRQVLANLVANAIKFTERGGIEIRVARTVTDAMPASDRVVLRWSVTDSGIGIAAAARSQLFQPFSQLDDSSTRRFGGSGLGLAICQQLVTAMGGRIDVETSEGQGSTFWFELPFESVAGTQTVATRMPTNSGEALVARVLIAEDNVTNSHLVMEMLELAGCKASVVNNGREAIDKLEHDDFDLVLMDWHMPEMDGVVATRTWRDHERALPGTRHVPIIALTASVLPGDRETCLQAGMDDFLAKPFTYDELFDVVQRWVPKQVAKAT